MKIQRHLRAVPPLWWVGLVALSGVAFLAWHMHGKDVDDTDWTDPQQPPDSLALPIGPGMSGRPMDTSRAFRGRRFVSSLSNLGGSDV